MTPPRRSALERFASRSHRSVKSLLSTAMLLGLAIFFAMDLEIPGVNVKEFAIAVGLSMFLLAGVPLLLIQIAEKTGLRRTRRRIFPAVARWAHLRGWQLERKPPKNHPAIVTVKSMRESFDAVAEEMPAEVLLPTTIYHGNVKDIALQHEPVAFTATITQMLNPEMWRRIMVMSMPTRLPPVAIADKKNEYLLSRKGFQVESGHFNQRYNIRASTPQLASAMVHPRMMELLVQAPLAVERVDIVPGWVVAYLSHDAAETDLEAAYRLVSGFAALAPRHLAQPID